MTLREYLGSAPGLQDPLLACVPLHVHVDGGVDVSAQIVSRHRRCALFTQYAPDVDIRRRSCFDWCVVRDAAGVLESSPTSPS